MSRNTLSRVEWPTGLGPEEYDYTDAIPICRAVQRLAKIAADFGARPEIGGIRLDAKRQCLMATNGSVMVSLALPWRYEGPSARLIVQSGGVLTATEAGVVNMEDEWEVTAAITPTRAVRVERVLATQPYPEIAALLDERPQPELFPGAFGANPLLVRAVAEVFGVGVAEGLRFELGDPAMPIIVGRAGEDDGPVDTSGGVDFAIIMPMRLRDLSPEPAAEESEP